MEGITNKALFIRIRGGKFERDAIPGDPVDHVVVREVGDNKYSKFQFDYIEGIITDLYITNKKIKDEDVELINIALTDGEESRIIQTWLSSSAARGILRRIENCNYTEPIKISVGWDMQKGCAFTWLQQHMGNIPIKYTKDAPEDCPPLEQVQYKGKTRWDDTKQLAWWRKKIQAISKELKALHEPKYGKLAKAQQNGDEFMTVKEREEWHH